MSYPNSGFIKIYPDNVSIVSGRFSFNSDVPPQPDRPVEDLDAYYDARVTNLAIAPCLTRDLEYPPLSSKYVPVVDNYELSFSPSSIGFEFYNGSYPSAPVATVDFLSADLPMGMAISQLVLMMSIEAFIGPNRDRSIDSIKFNYFGSNFYTVTPSIGIFSQTNLSSPTSGVGAIIPSLSNHWSIIQAMKSFGLTIPVNSIASAATGIPRAVISECFLLGVYNTLQFVFTSSTPNALPGEIADLQSSSGSLTLLDIDEFKIYWDTLEGETDVNPLFPGWTGGIRIPRYLILIFTATLFKFIIPKGIPYGGRRLMLTGTGTGTTFFGEFPLQNYNVQLVNGSGLYTLVDNQHHDTYYDRSVTPPVTIDLKIPDPFAKTAFLNS